MTLCALTACDPPPNHPAASAVQQAIAASQPAASVEFIDFFNLNQNIKQKLAQATPEQANQLLATHREQVQTYLAKLNQQQHDFLTLHYFDEKNWQEMASEPRQATGELKQKMQNLAAVQLRYHENAQGGVTISTQADYYLNLFENYVTPDVKAFLKLQAQQAHLPDNQDNIGQEWAALGEQVFQCEEFIRQYPQSAYLNEVKQYFNDNTALFLFGTEHEPVEFVNEPELKDLAQEFAQIEKSWTDYAKHHEKSAVVPMLTQARQIARLKENRIPAMEAFKKINFKK